MKLKYILSIFAIAAAAAACTQEAPVSNPDQAISITPSLMYVPIDGDSREVVVEASIQWYAETEAEWIHITPVPITGYIHVDEYTPVYFFPAGKYYVTLEIDANEGKERQAEVIFSTANPDQRRLTIVQEGVSGPGSSYEDPMNCAQAYEAGQALSHKQISKKKYFIKGIICDISEEYGTKFGNATFWISDDGTNDGGPRFEVYRAKYFDNLEYDDTSKPNIKVGDQVMIYGNITNYNGISETAEKEAYLYELKAGETPEPEPGPEPEEVDATCAEVNAAEDGKTLYRVKGIVTRIVMDKEDATKYNVYGNFDITDETGTVYVYGLLPEKDGETKQDVLTTKGVKLGDVITVVGPKSSYNDNPQIKNAYYESHASVTPITCVEFNALEDGDVLYTITGTVKNIVMDKEDPSKYNKYGNFDVEDETGSVYVYGVVPASTGKGGQDLLTTMGVKEGDTVTVVSKKASYNGNPQMKNAYIYLHN